MFGKRLAPPTIVHRTAKLIVLNDHIYILVANSNAIVECLFSINMNKYSLNTYIDSNHSNPIYTVMQRYLGLNIGVAVVIHGKWTKQRY